MGKIELKHVAPYLPYGLKGMVLYEDDNTEICTLGIKSFVGNICDINEFINGEYLVKPILRPLSNLETYFKELWYKKDKEVREFLDSDFLILFEIDIETIQVTNNNYLPVGLYNLLLKHHFDVFGLIEKNSAIDINTLNK